MPATATQPRRTANPPLRFASSPKLIQRSALNAHNDGAKRIVVDQSNPFQSLLVGSFNMNSGVVETQPASSRPNTPGSIFANEPVSVPRDPVRLTTQVDLELERVGQLAEKLKELAAETPIIPVSTAAPAQLFASQASALPVEVLNRARKGARDAWCAVVLMGIFIVGGMSWTSARLDRADTRIAELLAQLQTEQNSSNLLRAENRQAFDELADVKAHLKAIQHEQSLSTR